MSGVPVLAVALGGAGVDALVRTGADDLGDVFSDQLLQRGAEQITEQACGVVGAQGGGDPVKVCLTDLICGQALERGALTPRAPPR